MIVQLCQKIAAAPLFHRAMIAVILLAGVVVGFETNHELVARHGALFHTIDRLILGIFVFEILVKITALGSRWPRFFGDGWNLFDLVIVLVCLIPHGGSLGPVLRLARVLRLLRLVSALPRLQLLVGALLHSFSSMTYVGMMVALMIYIYSVMGVFFFSHVSPEHFGHLGSTMLTLFQVITLEGWVDIMKSLTTPETGTGVVAWQAAAYFISFILFGTMIMMNLFIGVIMNSMQEVHAKLDAEADKTPGLEDDFGQIESEIEHLQQRVRALRENYKQQARKK